MEATDDDWRSALSFETKEGDYQNVRDEISRASLEAFGSSRTIPQDDTNKPSPSYPRSVSMPPTSLQPILRTKSSSLKPEQSKRVTLVGLDPVKEFPEERITFDLPKRNRFVSVPITRRDSGNNNGNNNDSNSSNEGGNDDEKIFNEDELHSNHPEEETHDHEPRNKRISVISRKALDKIAALEQQVDSFSHDITSAKKIYDNLSFKVHNHRSVIGTLKHNLKKYIEEVETFQYVSIDRLVTTDLLSGKQEAKSRRDKLNHRCDEIRAEQFKLKDELKDWRGVFERRRDGETSMNSANVGSKENDDSGEQEGADLVRRMSVINPDWLSEVDETKKGTTEEKKEEPLFKSTSSGNEDIDEDKGAAEGILITPEWDSITRYAKMWNPKKESCKRYVKCMQDADLQVDKKVLDFLFTPEVKHAQSLRLSDRPMRLPEMDILGRLFSFEFHKACKLRELSLCNMQLMDAHVTKFCLYLPDIPTLEILTLNQNNITDAGVVEIAKVLNCKVNETLTELNLENNAFRERGCVSIASVINNLPNLAILSLNGNSIGDYGVYSLVSSMLKNVPASFDWEPAIPKMPSDCTTVSQDLTAYLVYKKNRLHRNVSKELCDNVAGRRAGRGNKI